MSGDERGGAHGSASTVCVWPCRPNGAREPDRRARERSRLRLAVGLTAATMLVEAAAGYLTGSLALISDAGHMLTHAFALGVALAAITLAGRPASPERSFGHHRVEILAALLNGAALLAVTGGIAWEAVRRFRAPVEILRTEMLLVAILGLAVNLATAFLLHDLERSSINIRAAFLHVLGDTVSSVAVVIGAILIGATGRLWIDPALSVGICVLIVIWSVGLIRDAVHVLLEAAPKGISIDKLRAAVLERFPGVVSVDDVHVWTVASGMVAMTAHVSVETDSLAECCALGDRIEQHLRSAYGISHVTLQFVRR